MLRTLRIDNFALIDKTVINFTNGFTVITGETGSGKSILLNALNLIIGERANFSVIGNRKDKSIVEAEIEINGFGLEPFFEKYELDYFETTILRREIYKQGRSRAFINDVPVQLSTLKEFSSGLIHIHSQYNTLELKDLNFQLKVLDVLAGTLNDVADYTKLFRSYQSLKQKLAKLETVYADSTSLSDYNSFQLNELELLDFDNNNYDDLQSELDRAENADELKIVLSEIVNGLKYDGRIVESLTQLDNLIKKNSKIQDVLNDLKSRLNSASIELSDIANEAESQLDDVEIDPKLLMNLTSKLDSYNKCLHKHKCLNQEGLVAFKDSLNKESDDLNSLTNDIESLKHELAEIEIKLDLLSNELHQNRLKAIPSIEQKIVNSLKELNLVDTKMSFDLASTPEWTLNGKSKLEILFSPNLGIEPVPIHQAASGGELSRVMLALQNLMSKKIKQHTILFDEIDTGVSGNVAHKIAMMLKQMGAGMQVIAITHLPQVAAKGGQHLLVSKSKTEENTLTSVTELDIEQRIEETARLLSGDEINTASLENAKVLISE